MTIVRTLLALSLIPGAAVAQTTAQAAAPVFGFRDFTAEVQWDKAFLAVPDAKLAGEHLRTLTASPHWASSPEDLATANYVADRFRAAGLKTELVPYRIYLNKPKKIVVEAFDAAHHNILEGPTPEHVSAEDGGDPFQDDPRVFTAFNGSSPSGDVTGEVVYANYGTLADFKHLRDTGVDLHGKIALVRYGQNFRGVKVYIAQQLGIAGVLIYSDPADDGYVRGDIYPKGPYRPATGVQRGSVQFIAKYTGDPMTPGVASTPDLPDSARLRPDQLAEDNPTIPSNPISYHDAEPILRALAGPESPREWQGALPFTYHLGSIGKAGSTPAVTAHLHLEQDYDIRTIWNIIGTIPGTTDAGETVILGNHRDAWVFGAVDPSSGTAAMLETVHGLGELLKQGWHPKRTVIVASWDAEEEGLIGSTEWVEQQGAILNHAVAYFNVDIGVSGPHFSSEAVPALKPFIREIAREVPSAAGGTVYDAWLNDQKKDREHEHASAPTDVHVGNLGSGSDYTPFLQHAGVPSTDITSGGNYGVYHSVFDNYAWYTHFADPHFLYLQQQARFLGLEVLHMADADVLPYDYRLYAHEIADHIESSARQATTVAPQIDLAAARAAAHRLQSAADDVYAREVHIAGGTAADIATFNTALRRVETDLLNPAGLPNRPWYKHTIYAPGEYTGYAAVVLPGVAEALDGGLNPPDAARAQQQLTALTDALNRAASTLESVRK